MIRYKESFNALFAIGIIFLVIGLANKDKWKKNRITRKKLSKAEKNIRIVILVILSILFIVGLVVFFLTQKGLI